MLGNLNNPLVTADFLMESMDTPGPIAVLGLQGIFILVKDYNLECPNIYGKLYNFFTTDMFNFRYKTRLFYLADIFLRSTVISATTNPIVLKFLLMMIIIYCRNSFKPDFDYL